MQKVSLIPRELPYDVNEQYKYLRTNIQFCGADKKVILFTSAVPGEGKSTTTLELAKSMASLGKRVLLIDADLRKSHLKHELVDMNELKYGLSHFLSGMVTLGEALCETDDPYLNIIFAGPVPPNPSELLSAHRIAPMVEWARNKYDYIFIDTAPLTAVIDAAVVAPVCDGAVLVIEAENIPYRMAQSVVTQLKNTGVNILGVVLNKVDFANSENHKQYYKRYGYRKYYNYEYGK